MKPSILPLVFALLLLGPRPVAATTCTLTGSADIQPMDVYYCDTAPTGGTQSCTGWKEVNLDSTTQPMRYMQVRVYKASDGSFLTKTYTNSSGAYTATFTLPSCNVDVDVQFVFKRIHESDLAAGTPRWRFRLVSSSAGSSTWGTTWTVPLTGSTTTYDRHWTRGANPGISTRLANVYYTANSTISEMTTWTSNLSAQFANTSESDGEALRIMVDPNADPSPVAYAHMGGWYIWLMYDDYSRGGTTRHELGHIAHYGLHSRKKINDCSSYRYDSDSSNTHSFWTCEWGQPTTDEAMASFLGVRSVTTNDTNAWFCWGASDSNQDTCSEGAISPDGDDRIYSVNGGQFVGVGDAFVTTSSHCARMATYSCNCFDVNSNGICDSYGDFGWRSEIQTMRFLWDIIDTNNENGNDDTDESMVSLADLFEAMTCESANSGDFGNDGECNEPNRYSSIDCDPSSDMGLGITPMTSTRDAYNAWDIGDLVPLNQTTERQINCVDGASD